MSRRAESSPPRGGGAAISGGLQLVLAALYIPRQTL